MEIWRRSERAAKAGFIGLALVLILAGAPGAGAAPIADRVTIGFMLPLTGFAAAEGNGVKEGADLAVRLINEAGGVRVGG